MEVKYGEERNCSAYLTMSWHRMVHLLQGVSSTELIIIQMFKMRASLNRSYIYETPLFARCYTLHVTTSENLDCRINRSIIK